MRCFFLQSYFHVCNSHAMSFNDQENSNKIKLKNNSLHINHLYIYIFRVSLFLVMTGSALMNGGVCAQSVYAGWPTWIRTRGLTVGRRANTELAPLPPPPPPSKLRQLVTIILLPVGIEDLLMYVDPDSGQSFFIRFWPPFWPSGFQTKPLNMKLLK